MDTDGSKEVEFQEFLQVIAAQKVEVPADSDTREAFHALGGNVRVQLLADLILHGWCRGCAIDGVLLRFAHFIQRAQCICFMMKTYPASDETDFEFIRSADWPRHIR